jgi:hypothetical protein
MNGHTFERQRNANAKQKKRWTNSIVKITYFILKSTIGHLILWISQSRKIRLLSLCIIHSIVPIFAPGVNQLYLVKLLLIIEDKKRLRTVDKRLHYNFHQLTFF